MSKKFDSGRNPALNEWREAQRVAELPLQQQRTHPTAIASDTGKLRHINTYGHLPDFNIDQPFSCRQCGKQEIWRAADQKWYYEEAKGHIDAKAVECHDCRKKKDTPVK